MDDKQKRARRVRAGSAAVVVLAAAALPLYQSGCSGNQLPPNPLPAGDGPRALPGWYAESAWSAKGGSSRVLIEGKVVFDTDKAEIRPGSEKVLATLLRFLQEFPEVTRLRVEGHTDSRASEEHNQELSARRSLAVCNWLVDHGVDAVRLLAVGFGESRPLGPNELADGRAENRRTEFHVAELNGALFQTKDPTNGGLELPVLTAEQRRKANEKVAVPTAPPPPPFKATGNIVRDLVSNGPTPVAPAAPGAKNSER